MKNQQLTVITLMLSGCTTMPTDLPNNEVMVVQNQSCLFFCEAQVEVADHNTGPVSQSEQQSESLPKEVIE